MKNNFCIGLDLGQASDYTTLAVVEKLEGNDASSRDPGDRPGDRVPKLHLRHLERYPLRTPYPEIADRVAALMRRDELTVSTTDQMLREVRVPPELVIDQTGVGAPVADLLRERNLTFRSVVITGGDRVNREGRTYRVPKRDLVSALEVSLQTGALKAAEGLELWPALRQEMQNFRRKIDLRTAHDSYEHWREGDHDDLVLAACLACWGAMNSRRGAVVYAF
jgi:hypothetical protein